MSELDRQPSPSEFLAALKSQDAPTSHLEKPDANSLDSLDFSDLDESSEPEVGEIPTSLPEEDSSSKDGIEATTDVQPGDVSNPGNVSNDVQPGDATGDVQPGDVENESGDQSGEDNQNNLVEEASSTGEDNSEPMPEDKSEPTPVTDNSKISALFDRVNSLLGETGDEEPELFRPEAPSRLEETGLTPEDIEKLVLKFLLTRDSETGRDICAQICIPFHFVDPVLKQLKNTQILVYKGTAEVGDYDYAMTDLGRERAERYSKVCSYCGPAPVSLDDYLEAMEAQSISKQVATEEDLREAFSDLVMTEELLGRLGPAVNSGRGMFLFGEPGNGKTSIAERIAKAFSSTIWIPRTMVIDGEIIRIYDPAVHEIIEDYSTGLFDDSDTDARWVQIERPTVIAGGELTMDELELVQNPQSKICEAPLQLKSNCGILVIDDFGRQIMPAEALLNRWIVPLEKRFDYLNLPSGKKIQVPFDQLIIFSTNLDPAELVDDAFLRRIPYKIEVPNPSEEDFRKICERVAPTMGLECDKASLDYLIEHHYNEADRPFRACQPRDLLLQVRNFCVYKRLPKKMSPEAFDFAVENYFSAM